MVLGVPNNTEAPWEAGPFLELLYTLLPFRRKQLPAADAPGQGAPCLERTHGVTQSTLHQRGTVTWALRALSHPWRVSFQHELLNK